MFAQEIDDLSDFPTVKAVAHRNDFHSLQVNLDLPSAFPNVNVRWIMIIRIQSDITAMPLPVQDCNH